MISVPKTYNNYRFKNQFFLFFICLIIFALIAKPVISQESENFSKNRDLISLDELLNTVKKGAIYDNKKNYERIQSFKSEKSKQDKRLKELNFDISESEKKSQELELSFSKNDETLIELEEKLDDRLGSIKELFGVLQQVSSDAQARYENSITQTENPDRDEFLQKFSAKMGQTRILPAISEIERLWYELQKEMTDSSKVHSFNHSVANAEGQSNEQNIIRVGLFNVISQGKYLQYIPETTRLIEYAQQPRSRYMQGVTELSQASAGELVDFSIDPTRGQLIALLVRAPKLKDRIQQGGVIGYIIISVGIFAILFAFYRYLLLSIVHRKIKKQVASLEVVDPKNPLGRILNTYINNQKNDQETVELKLGEAVLREVPSVNRGVSLLKIIAAIAPLMGLLGTVTGMIITFQAITLFGAGDPKLMANGISQALVTTVLGLTVAIPSLLLHNILQSKSKEITDVLEQESVAIVAGHSEGLST